MLNWNLHWRFLSSFIAVSAFFVMALPSAYAQDTKQLVYNRCSDTQSGCHSKTRWEGKKKTKREWAAIVDRMVRYGAKLTSTEDDLVVEYLTNMSKGIKTPATTTTTKPKTTATTVRVRTISGAGEQLPEDQQGVYGAGALDGLDQANAMTTTLQATTTTLTEQAHTGIEMIWYLLGGGMMVSSGLALRNKDRQLSKRD